MVTDKLVMKIYERIRENQQVTIFRMSHITFGMIFHKLFGMTFNPLYNK